MRTLRLFIGPTAALLLAGCALAAPHPAPRAPTPPGHPREVGRLTPVNQVENISIRLLESYPEQIHISARGQANSVARDGQLRLRSVRKGIYEFDFLARLPRGPITMMMGPITAHHTMIRPQNFRGVRIHSQTNSITERVR